MTRPLAIMTGDWHLVSHAWKSRPTLSGDAECALRQVAQFSRSSGLPIIAAGDLFDSKHPGMPNLYPAHQLLRETKGYYIQGNHERQSLPWMLLVAPNWRHLENQSVTLTTDGIPHAAEIIWRDDIVILPPLFATDKTWNVYGLDFTGSTPQLRERLDALEMKDRDGEANLLVLHQSTPQMMPMDLNELQDNMVPDAVDLIVVGHCHQASTFAVTTQSGRSIPGISPGGFHLLSILESPKKRMAVLFSDGSVRTVPLVTRRVLAANLCGKTDSDVREEVATLRRKIKKGKKRPPEIDKPIVYARMNESTSQEAERIVKSELGESAHLFFKRERSDAAPGTPDVSRLENIDIARHTESGFEYIRGIFRDFEPDTEVRGIVEGLLETDPSYETYQTLKSRFLETQTC